MAWSWWLQQVLLLTWLPAGECGQGVGAVPAWALPPATFPCYLQPSYPFALGHHLLSPFALAVLGLKGASLGAFPLPQGQHLPLATEVGARFLPG